MRSLDLRSCMKILEENDRLVRIRKEVDREFELAGIAWKFSGGPAVLFENVKGYKIPVIAGVFNAVNQPLYFGEKDIPSLRRKFFDALDEREKPKIVGEGPVQDFVITEDIELLKILPVPWHNRGEAGPFTGTAGICVSKDPETGVRSQSIHRMQVKGPDKTGFMIAPGIKRHKEIMLSKAEKMGKPLEVAVVIGMDPAVAIAAAGFSTSFQGLSTTEHMDKYEIAGALRGEPIELVRCKTVDLEVPANAEFVLEGEILAGVREPDGPFSEGGGYYGSREMRYGGTEVFHVKAITHRRNPIYHTLLGSSREHGYGGILRSVCVQKYNLHFIQRFCPAITAFNVVGLYMAIVAVDKTIEGQQKNAMLTVMGTHPLIKFVVVVDKDVDVFDLNSVFRAIGRRFHGDKSIITIPDAYTRPLDPATRKVKYSMGMMTKVGIDATMLLDKAIDQPMVEYEEIDLTRYLTPEEIEKHLKLRL